MSEGNDPNSIETGGGSFTGRDVHAGGDFIGRDQINQYIQLDLPKLLATLREALPAGDPAPARLLETLKSFRHYHTLLYEWKELHNLINEVVYATAQFAREVERLDGLGHDPRPRSIGRLWRPVSQRVNILLEWAAGVEHIAERPFAVLESGLQGPPWAVELAAARNRVDGLLDQDRIDIAELYDATFDFADAADRHMYLADRSLRETAGELYNLSRIVLGSLHGDTDI